MSPRMLTAVLLTSSFLAVVSTRNLNGVLRYHTDAAGRPNYTPTFGHLCNDSQCMRDAKRQWRPLTHSPVLLSLDELERRQRVAALHRQYISSQQYRPHPQPAAFDLHSLGSHVILAQPHHHRNHHQHPHPQNPQGRQESSAAAAPPDQQSDPHSPHKYRHSHHHPHNQPSHQVAPLLHPVSPFNGNRIPAWLSGRGWSRRSVKLATDAATGIQDDSHGVPKYGHQITRASVRNREAAPAAAAAHARRAVYDMTHSRVLYDFGVPGLTASLSFRVSPTSPPHRTSHSDHLNQNNVDNNNIHSNQYHQYQHHQPPHHHHHHHRSNAVSRSSVTSKGSVASVSTLTSTITSISTTATPATISTAAAAACSFTQRGTYTSTNINCSTLTATTATRANSATTTITASDGGLETPSVSGLSSLPPPQLPEVFSAKSLQQQQQQQQQQHQQQQQQQQQRPQQQQRHQHRPLSGPSSMCASGGCNHTADTVRVIHNDTCIRCPRRQLARALRNQHLARVPRPKLRFCSRPEDSVIDFPLMVLRGPRMGTFVEEGEYTIVFKTLLPLPAKTCRYTLQVYSLRCPPLPAAEHGSLQCTNGNLWGSRCHLRCDTGFELRGQTTADGYVLNRPNVTATFKCVKRKRQAIWKLPNFQPVCTDKRFVFPTTTKPPKRISFSTKNPGVTSPAPKRRVACRWPKEPPDGWATCGLRGRWKKRLFVREHLPCFRGCNDGFEPSVKLNVDGKKNKISCVGGAWMGFQDFACVNKRDERWKACLRQADKQDHVVCKRTDTSMKCRLECPEGFVVAKRDRPRAEFDCQADDASQHAWPVCQKALPPKLVDGCQNQMVENATFPLPIEEPIYRPAGDDTGPVAVYCNVTAIEQHGEFGIYCTAEDLQLESQANCTFTLFSTASSCRPFKPGKHVVANCGMPSGLLAGIIGYESLPVGALCEFACEKGYTLPTSRLEETYTTCQNDGTWTVSDFDLCKPLENPVVQRACENQTFVVSQIPAGGIPLALPEYVDSMGDDIEPECTHSLVKEFGETLVSCDFDDYEIRTRVSCTFSVTVQRG